MGKSKTEENDAANTSEAVPESSNDQGLDKPTSDAKNLGTTNIV